MANITRVGVPVRPFDDAGKRRRAIRLYTGPSSYPVNGDPVTAAQLGIGEITMVHFPPVSAVTGPSTGAVYFLRHDPTFNTIRWYDNTAEVEAATGFDLSALATRFEAVGR